jgi:hypothetical protein
MVPATRKVGGSWSNTNPNKKQKILSEKYDKKGGGARDWRRSMSQG